MPERRTCRVARLARTFSNVLRRARDYEIGSSQGWIAARELAVVVIMMATLLALYMPGHLRTLPLVPALLYIVIDRKSLLVDAAIRKWAILFVSYIAIFTLLAENSGTAWKGMYDILRGCLYFFTGYFFGAKLQTENQYPWLLLILAAVLGGNFLVQQGAILPGSPHTGFYGYHANPNNSAFVVVAVLAFVLPALFPPRKSATCLLTGIAGIGMGLVLLYFANSRSAWVAVFLGLTALGFLTLRNRRALLMLVSLTATILLAVVLLYFNRKGFTMPVRLETWSTLIQITANEHIWLGHGINNTKEILVDTGLAVLIAHNLIVDVFVSSGIIGTMIFVSLCFGLLRILVRVNHADNTAVQTGLSGLVMFGVISMFDLKFASIVLIGTFAFFSGVIYAQVLMTEDC